MSVVLVNIYGAPGSGKSTMAAELFSKLKKQDKSVELLSEYVKQWVWEDRKFISLDQFYFLGKQFKKEYSVYDKVKIIITDSPLGIIGHYTETNFPDLSECINQSLKKIFNIRIEKNIKEINYFLNRNINYSSSGRFQTELEANNMENSMKKYLNLLGVNFTEGSSTSIIELEEIICQLS